MATGFSSDECFASPGSCRFNDIRPRRRGGSCRSHVRDGEAAGIRSEFLIFLQLEIAPDLVDPISRLTVGALLATTGRGK